MGNFCIRADFGEVHEVPLNATRTTHGASAAGLWWRIGTHRYRRSSRLPRRAAGVLAAAASLAASTAAAASPPAISFGQAGGPAAPSVGKVATGPARSLGEPAAAQDAGATAVTATTFGAAGAQAVVWTKRAGATTWRRTGAVLPAGFGSSYDPAAAAAPGGPLLVVAGTAPPGEQCITNGSVAIASVGSGGTLSAGPAGQRSARDGQLR